MELRPRTVALAVAVAVAAIIPFAWADDDRTTASTPQVVLISLDGAQPDLVEHYLKIGVLDRRTGLGRLKAHGVVAEQNITATPSVTAVSHIAIATGSTAPHNDISANTFHPVAAAIGISISGFAAPIGGYRLSPLGPSPAPTAEPLWVQLRLAGKKVVTATWPGSDGVHTAVSLRNLLVSSGIDVSQLGLRTTGPSTNLYVNLQGRETGGAVTPADFPARVAQIAAALSAAVDPNRFFNPDGGRLFSHVWTRPHDCGSPGFCTDENIGQDTGDVLALMVEGYNFDGTQNPGVARLGDAPFDTATTVYSVPNFYGAHGHDSNLRSMSAIFYAAGPSLKQRRTVDVMHNVDVAPTVLEILGVPPAPTVDGDVIFKILDAHGHKHGHGRKHGHD